MSETVGEAEPFEARAIFGLRFWVSLPVCVIKAGSATVSRIRVPAFRVAEAEAAAHDHRAGVWKPGRIAGAWSKTNVPCVLVSLHVHVNLSHGLLKTSSCKLACWDGLLERVQGAGLKPTSGQA